MARIQLSNGFPYFFVGTFIEGVVQALGIAGLPAISLLFRRDFH